MGDDVGQDVTPSAAGMELEKWQNWEGLVFGIVLVLKEQTWGGKKGLSVPFMNV